MIQFLTMLSPISLASIALAALGALWIAKTHLTVDRLNIGRTLRLAAALYMALTSELERIEARNRHLRSQPRRPAEPAAHAAAHLIAGPDLLEDRHGMMISELRTRTESVYRGARFQTGAALESTCRKLETIAREVRELAAVIDGRSRPRVAKPAMHRAPRPSALAVLEAA